MNRLLQVIIVAVVVLGCLAVRVGAGSSMGRGVYIAVLDEPAAKALPAGGATSSAREVLITLNSRLYVASRITVSSSADVVAATLTKLKDRQNNVYAMAINTEGIVRATVAVTDGDKVYLRARRSGEPSPVLLAEAPK